MSRRRKPSAAHQRKIAAGKVQSRSRLRRSTWRKAAARARDTLFRANFDQFGASGVRTPYAVQDGDFGGYVVMGRFR